LVDAGLVKSLPDLYELTVGDLRELEGWGETSAENLVREIAATTEPALADFLTALGIPEVGDTTARALARAFGTFEAVREASEDQLQEVEDIGPTVAAEVRDFFDSEHNAAVIDGLLEHVDPQPADTGDGDILAGETFVFTGALERFTRAEAQELVERHGGSATGSVSGNTDYLVVGEDPGRTKREDAEAEGVPQLGEAEFLEVLSERGIDVE
ncbi:MAG: helix-hairpin-helix domain-containing protein, partial [Haloarculaceae archaeon]